MPCSNCTHFLSRGVIDASADPAEFQGRQVTGVCRRYPPRIESVSWTDFGAEGFSVFPLVHQDQLCGEYAPTMPI